MNHIVYSMWHPVRDILAMAFVFTPRYEPLNIYAGRMDHSKSITHALHEWGHGEYSVVVRVGNARSHYVPLALAPLERVYCTNIEDAALVYSAFARHYAIDVRHMPPCVIGALGLN